MRRRQSTRERDGAKILGRPDTRREAGSAHMFVRTYYRNQADEIVFYDAGPFTFEMAERQAAILSQPYSGAVAADVVPAREVDNPHRVTIEGARRVLPSQQEAVCLRTGGAAITTTQITEPERA